MKVIWQPQAVDDLIRIGRYIARDDPQAARRWVERLKTRAEAMEATPRAGRVVPETGRDDIREVLGKAYRIVYQVTGDELRILTVFEGHRRLPTEVLPANDD